MHSLRNNVLVEVTSNLEQAIAEQPIAYDVDEVAERLKKEIGECIGKCIGIKGASKA